MADFGWEVPPELLQLSGDADSDNDVDGADFLLWQRNLGGMGGSLGDVNGDLFVDDYDGWIIRHYLGAKGAPSGSLATPEPAAFSMFAIGALVGAWARRRRRKVAS
jgi:hypothetical protein